MMGFSEGSQSPGETLWSVRRFLEVLARRQPLVLIIEDLHWAEPTLLDLIEYIADRSHDAAILLVGTARPELLDERPGWSGRANAATMRLEPLSREQASVLIGNLLGGAELVSEARARVLDAAEGNPLFLEQLLSMLIDDGFLQYLDGSWVPVGELAAIPVPTAIQAVLAARLDRLGDQERRAIECAAVIGREFRRLDVEELVPNAMRHEVGDRLMSLVRRDLIRLERVSGGGDTYRFRHILVLNAAYRSIPKHTRADLHERFARRMEEDAQGRLAEIEEILGYHLAQAFRYRAELGPVDERGRKLASRAGHHLASAGHRAFVRGDMPAAVGLLSNASSLMPPDEPDRLRILPELGSALMEVGRMEKARQVLDEAVELASARADLGAKARALFYRRELYGWTGVQNADEGRTEAERMIPALEALGDHAALSYCWRIVAGSVGVDRWAEALERARKHARLAGDRLGQLEILQYLAGAALYDGTPVERAIRRCDELIEMAEGDRLAEAAVLVNGRGPLLAMAGRFDEARRDVARARATFQDLGLKLWLAAAGTVFFADVELLAGDPAAAERALRQGCEALERMRASALVSAEAGILARALYEQGRYAEAEKAEERARLAEETEPDYYMGRGTRARLLARAGRTDEALEVARAGVAAAVRQSSRVRADELMALADVLRLCGRPADAVPAAQEALELYERKGNVVLAARAQALLAEFATRPGPSGATVTAGPRSPKARPSR